MYQKLPLSLLGLFCQRNRVIHDITAVGPVGERLVGAAFVVDTAGHEYRVDRQELGQFAHQRVKVGFTGGADGGLDQPLQAIVGIAFAALGRAAPGTVGSRSRSGPRSGSRRQSLINMISTMASFGRSP